MNILLEIWQAVAPYFAGVTVSGLVSAVIFGCLKGSFNKTINKINVDKIAENATERGIEKVKKISFEQSIQPIAESELKKITENANQYIEAKMSKMEDYHKDMLLILEAQAKYFDNSIGVPEEAKADLRRAIETAKNRANFDVIKVQTIKVEEPIKEAVKVAETPKIVAEQPKKTIKVER